MRYIFNFFKKWQRQPAWFKTLVGLVLGVLAGFVFKEKVLVFQPLGLLYIKAINMMVGPVMLVSIVSGIMNMKDPVKMGRIAGKTGILFVLTTIAASTITALVSLALLPSHEKLSTYSLPLDTTVPAASATSSSFGEILLGLVPKNIFTAFVDGNVVQILLVSVLIGIGINMAGPAAKPVENLIESLMKVVFKVIEMIMQITPYAVFALLAELTGNNGTDFLAVLLGVVGTSYLAQFIILFGVYSIILSLYRINPLQFFKKMFEVQLVAFSTSSSAASLGINMKVTNEKLGVARNITNFVLPIGTTSNSHGLASYLTISALFAARMYGVDLEWFDVVKVIAICSLLSFGCPGIPAACLILLPTLLPVMGIPLIFIGVIASLDRFLDLMCTVNNVTGDTVTALVVAKTEGELDHEIYGMAKAEIDLRAQAAAATSPLTTSV